MATPRDVAFFAILSIDLGAFFVLLDFVKFRFQHLERELAVASLAAFRLTGNHDPAWLVQNPHSGFHFVHVLPAFAAAPESVDLQISGIDFNWGGIGDLRNNIDAREGSVTTFVCIKGRNTHEPVHAPLGLEMSVSVLAAHQQRHRFNANFFALLDIDGL